MIALILIIILTLLTLINFKNTGKDEDGFLLFIMCLILTIMIIAGFCVNNENSIELERAKIEKEKAYIEVMLESNDNEYWRAQARVFNAELESKKDTVKNWFYGIFGNKGCLGVEEIEIRRYVE